MTNERERDDQGRFMSGHTISKGHGRPPKAKEERLHQILVNALGDGKWEAIVQRAVTDAITGNAVEAAQARKWLANYGLGTPIHRSEDSGRSTPDDWLRAMRDDPEPEEGY